MRIFIENPYGTAVKKEFENGKWRTIGRLAVPYPYPYGFIPNTKQKDGDPLDVFFITSKSSGIRRGDVIEVSVLGMAEFFEDGKRDSKILARKASEKIELNQKVKSVIKEFLIHAFDNNPTKKVEFNGFYGSAEARREIMKCVKENKMESLEPELRPEYVEKLNKIRKQPGLKFKTVDELLITIKRGLKDAAKGRLRER